MNSVDYLYVDCIFYSVYYIIIFMVTVYYSVVTHIVFTDYTVCTGHTYLHLDYIRERGLIAIEQTKRRKPKYN